MAAPPCPVCASTRGAAAIAVAAAPVASMSRRVESIIIASRLLCFGRLSDLVLRHRVEIISVMALVQLARGVAGHAIDHAATLYGRALGDLVGPALDVLVFVHGQELSRAVDDSLGER